LCCPGDGLTLTARPSALRWGRLLKFYGLANITDWDSGEGGRFSANRTVSPWLARWKKKVYKVGSGRAIIVRGRMRPATEGRYGDGSDGHGDSASSPGRVAAGWGGQDGWATASVLHQPEGRSGL